jgi:hypothetical protein
MTSTRGWSWKISQSMVELVLGFDTTSMCLELGSQLPVVLAEGPEGVGPRSLPPQSALSGRAGDLGREETVGDAYQIPEIEHCDGVVIVHLDGTRSCSVAECAAGDLLTHSVFFACGAALPAGCPLCAGHRS